jgi:uncharacterized protein (DUF2267 family)
MAVQYAEFIDTVEGEAGLPEPDADRAVRATLETLAERLSDGEAHDLAEQLPPELRPLMDHAGRAQPFDLHEFLRRVAEREGTEEQTAKEHARAVFRALGATVSREELHDMASELPKDFGELVEAAESAPPPGTPRERPAIDADTFRERVAQRAGLDPDAAARAIDAALEALAVRITAGQVEDLEPFLPPELQRPLERGRAESDGAAKPLSLDEFVRLIADREGVTPDEAREHARAVFGVLRAVVGDKEWHDTIAQLPRDYAIVRRP